MLEILCAADGPIPLSLVAEASGFNERALVKLLAPLAPFILQPKQSDREPQLSLWHKSFYDFLTAIENADSAFGIDHTEGDKKIASLFVDRVNVQLDVRASADAVPDYLRRRGLDHLALCGRFFDGLPVERVTALVYCSSWGAGGVAVGGLPTFAPAFVSNAMREGRLDAIKRLVEALDEVTRRHYINSGLIEVEERPDGAKTRTITLQAREAGPLHRALVTTGLAVSVVDQVLAQRATDPGVAVVVKKLGFMGYMAGGLSVAGWSYGLSGYFEDQGYALEHMISNLEKGLRAQAWKR